MFILPGPFPFCLALSLSIYSTPIAHDFQHFPNIFFFLGRIIAYSKHLFIFDFASHRCAKVLVIASLMLDCSWWKWNGQMAKSRGLLSWWKIWIMIQLDFNRKLNELPMSQTCILWESNHDARRLFVIIVYGPKLGV